MKPQSVWSDKTSADRFHPLFPLDTPLVRTHDPFPTDRIAYDSVRYDGSPLNAMADLRRGRSPAADWFEVLVSCGVRRVTNE